MPVPISTSESLERLAIPSCPSRPEVPNEVVQPPRSPVGLALPHGQALPLPSPKQTGATSESSFNSERVVGFALATKDGAPRPCRIIETPAGDDRLHVR